MKEGDRIRLQKYICGTPSYTEDYTIVEFRYCLGIFQSPQHEQASDFTPLCELYESGPESKSDYISNFGEYYTNPVQSWMDIP